MNRLRGILLMCCCILGGDLWSQCCSGGSGSPVAGGASQGVLRKHQFEINQNYQFITTGKSLTGREAAPAFINRFTSHYLYTRVGYGITKQLTISAELGYFPQKVQYGYENADTFSSRGVSDLLIFPRYNLLNAMHGGCNTEITLGLGVKFPLGMYNDSLNFFTHPTTGVKYYIRKPLALQPTNGSMDVIGYGFFYRGYPAKRLKFFMTLLYIRKGWNPLGEHFGDYFNIGVFAGKSWGDHVHLLAQIRAEHIGMMKRAPGLPMPNYDPLSTGSTKLFLSPQVSISLFDHLTVYYLQDIPLYQQVNGTQIATRFQATLGLSYRFMGAKTVVSPAEDSKEE